MICAWQMCCRGICVRKENECFFERIFTTPSSFGIRLRKPPLLKTVGEFVYSPIMGEPTCLFVKTQVE